MSNVIKIQVDNCLDCPHSKEIHDPSSSDSFDLNDVSLCCTKSPNNTSRKKTDRGELIPGRFIVVCERSIRRSEAKVPDWCPLLANVKKGRKP